eukprot:TRINITY_DN13658_c0_g4_i1.p1 TRINITY_DN13658_c0_g4~~TRINITY_DN13658_c0_g4_i1.p1  ORF type:complete len:555 (-),score=204.64 TRINITY_DN13658_c0_g4_i1:162-1826(-)
MADVAANWTEHTHGDGRRYYYNKVTKQSAWDKPECLKSNEEKLNTTPWKEYKTADGRDYFFHTVTKQSVWEMPLELKRLRGLAKDESEDEKEEEEKKEEEPEWKTPEERKQAFTDVLQEKGVKSTMKWEEASKLIQEDRRFNALNSAGERKQVFAEYISQAKKREKEEEREKKKRAKDDFVDALSAWKELKADCRYKDAAVKFCEEEWFKLMEEDERDDCFQDFMDEFEKKAKDERRQKRKEVVERVKKAYAEKEKITVLSRWREVQSEMREHEDFRWLTKLEALTSWEEWVLETEKKDLESKTKEKYRNERKSRDLFRDLLKELAEKGKIKADTRWGDFAKHVVDDDKYITLITQPGSTPHDLFDDYIDNLNAGYKEDRANIKKLLKKKGSVITPSSTYEWFEKELKDEDGFKNLPEEHRKAAFESLVEKAREAEEDAERNAKKNRKKFVELLQKSREVTAKTTFEKATKLLGSNAAWEAVDEATRRQCFDIFVDQLKIQSKGNDDDDASQSEDDKKKKKKVKDDAKDSKAAKKRKQEEASEEPEKKKSKKKK